MRLHCVTILDRTTHRELDTRFGSTAVGFEGHTTRQTANSVDIEFLLGNDFGCLGNLSCGNFASEQSDDVAVFALTSHPLRIVLLVDGAETDIDIQLVGFEQQILHNVARVVSCCFEQNTEREGLMDVCLTDVEDEGVVTRQDVGKR